VLRYLTELDSIKNDFMQRYARNFYGNAVSSELRDESEEEIGHWDEPKMIWVQIFSSFFHDSSDLR
jgi:flagellar motor component MotA